LSPILYAAGAPYLVPERRSRPAACSGLPAEQITAGFEAQP